MRNLILVICCFFISNYVKAQCQTFNPVAAALVLNSSNTVNFSVSGEIATPGTTTWYWEFGDGQTSTEQTPSHTYAISGEYTACVTGSCGSENVMSCVTVVAGAPSLCNLGPDRVICSGQSTTFSITGTWNLVEWTYNGNLVGTGNSITVSNQGTYCVKAYYADGTTCEDCVYVNVEDCPPPGPTACPLFALRQSSYFGPPCFGDLHLEELDKPTGSTLSSVFVNDISTGIGLEYDGNNFYTITANNDCYNPNSLVTIDEATGNTNVIANLGFAIHEGDISFNSNNELFMVTPDFGSPTTPNKFDFYHVCASGATLMGSYVHQNTSETAEISSISFDNSATTLYVIMTVSDGTSHRIEGFTINLPLFICNAFPPGPISFVTNGLLNNSIGTTSCYPYEGMDFDPFTGNFCLSYHDFTATNWGHGSRLYELDATLSGAGSITTIAANCPNSDYSDAYSGIALKCENDNDCDLGPDLLLCPGQSVTLTLTTPPYTWVNWYRNGNPIVNNGTNTMTFSNTGTYCAESLDAFGNIICEDCVNVLPDICPPDTTCCPLYGLVQTEEEIFTIPPSCIYSLSLVEINKVTGGFNSNVPVSGISTGIGLEHDGVNPNFYTVTQSNDCFTPNTLHEIDCVTGIATPIGQVIDSVTGNVINVNEGDLSFNNINELFMVINSSSTHFTLYYVNTVTGNAIPIGTPVQTVFNPGETSEVSSISFNGLDLIVMVTIRDASGGISVIPFILPGVTQTTTSVSPALSSNISSVLQPSLFPYEGMDYDEDCEQFCWAYHDIIDNNYPYNVSLYQLDNTLAVTGGVATNLVNDVSPFVIKKHALSGLAFKCETNPCNVEVELPQDTLTICEGESVLLEPVITGGVPGYTCTWSPTTGVFPVSANGCDAIIQPTTTTTYTVTVIDAVGCEGYANITLVVDTTCCCAADDLITNGDFSGGSTGFVTVAPLGSCGVGNGHRVTPTSCPPLAINEPYNLGGNYLQVYGPNNTTGTQTAYQSSPHTFTAGNQYTVHFHYHPNISGGNAASTVAINVAGNPIFVQNVNPNMWNFVSITWVQGTTLPSTIDIVQQLIGNGLNDIGIDNVVLCCKPNPCELEVSFPQESMMICHNDVYKMNPIIMGGTPPYSCSWTPTTNVFNPNDCNPIILAQSNTTYTVTVTDSLGCVAQASMTLEIDSTCCCTLDNNLLPNSAIDLGYSGFSSNLPQGSCPNTNEVYVLTNSSPCFGPPTGVLEPLGLGGNYLASCYDANWYIDYTPQTLTAGNDYCLYFDIYPDLDQSGKVPDVYIEYYDNVSCYSIPVGGLQAGQWNHVRYCWSQVTTDVLGFGRVVLAGNTGVTCCSALDNIRLCCEPGDSIVPPPSWDELPPWWENPTGDIGPWDGNFDIYQGEPIHQNSRYDFIGEENDLPNSNGKLDVWVDLKVEAYPNPTSGKLNITANNPLSALVEVYNVSGELVKQYKHSNNLQTTIDISDLSNGVYLLKVQSDKQIVTKRIVRQ